jgi:trans-aconitate methyltransferase
MAETDVFKHSTPELYDRYMGPLLFAPYAEYVAKRVAPLRPERILETAAGTGIVTRAVSDALPGVEIIATDINPVLVEFAAQQFQSEGVTFQAADARSNYRSTTRALISCSACSGPCSFRTRSERTQRRVASFVREVGTYS